MGRIHRPGHKLEGFTLLEALIALAILGLVMAIAYSGIVNSLSAQAQQESSVAAQGKMRRIVEVLSQELRSAVFGSIIDSPYSATDSSVSFLMLSGGAGYPISPFSSGATQVDVVAPSSGISTNNIVMVADQIGRAVLARVTNISSVMANGMRRFTLSCPIPMAHTPNTLMFEVTALGVRHDADREEVYLRSSLNSEEQSFAFDIADFRIDYIYVADGEEPVVRTAPHRIDGVPQPSFESGGISYELARLQAAIGVDVRSRTGVTRHSLTSQVELLRSQDYALRELTSCL